nr:ankyrin repeat domain-containing protein 11 [Onthophagus taurus]XP_022911764.1 ankyrin repeat domain-containing protein 11 [Onthophagus taurus]
MPSSVRPKSYTGGSRTLPVTPMSERQQMALLMQMTSSSNEASRSPSNSTNSSSNNNRNKDRNERGETPLHLAAIKGDVEQVSKLLAHRADPNIADYAGWTPLHEACNHGWYEVAYKLVQAGANVNAKGLDNETPLHDAAVNGHLKLVKLLVEKGADIHAKNCKGKTPLSIASPGVAQIMLDPTLPISESNVTRAQPRSRDDKKVTESNKQKTTSGSEENMDTSKGSEDVYEFKSVKETESSPDRKSNEPADMENDDAETANQSTTQSEDNKRSFSEVSENQDEATNDEEFRRKKRKDESGKEQKTSTPQRSGGQGKSASGKQTGGAQGKSSALTAVKNAVEKKSPCPSPKPTSTSDAEVEDGKSEGNLKVPPLKIVIPQSSTAEQETGQSRNGKNSSQRSQALPYVVPSSNNSDNDKENSGNSSPSDGNGKNDEKKEASGSNGDEQTTTTNELAEAATTSTSNSNSTTPAPTDMHPRKRKMKPKEVAAPAQDTADTPAVSEAHERHPHEQPITNCYQLFLNIRKQIEKRRKGLFPVQPKPPQGFKDYLMNRCTYVLNGNSPTTPNINYPATLQAQMKDLYTTQEKERYKLKMQHVIEKEKLVLSVEQEILRVHGKAARALANQSLPFSVCTILRDQEVYNLITPEQEEKDRNARSRYNGRLFLSWLQDVDDKWEKIKEHMLLRHHNEAESLHAVQKMDWEWKLKELSLCDAKSTPTIEELHVPMVHVSDDFDLLPA